MQVGQTQTGQQQQQQMDRPRGSSTVPDAFQLELENESMQGLCNLRRRISSHDGLFNAVTGTSLSQARAYCP